MAVPRDARRCSCVVRSHCVRQAFRRLHSISTPPIASRRITTEGDQWCAYLLWRHPFRMNRARNLTNLAIMIGFGGLVKKAVAIGYLPHARRLCARQLRARRRCARRLCARRQCARRLCARLVRALACIVHSLNTFNLIHLCNARVASSDIIHQQ